MVVENVRGAIPWVGRSRWNCGPFHLWGDIPALMPLILKKDTHKLPGNNAPRLWADRRTQRLGDAFRHDENALYCSSSGSAARKFASAMIAKIPEPLSRHIAAVYRP